MKRISLAWLWMLLLWLALPVLGCESADRAEPDGDTGDGDQVTDGDEDGDEDGDRSDGDVVDGDEEPILDGDVDGDEDGDSDDEDNEPTDELVDNLLPPPAPKDELGYVLPEREARGEPITADERRAFTRKVTGFFKDVGYWDWIWRFSHGLHESYDPDMMDYTMYWQDVGMRREGDTIVFFHNGRAENILKRTIKVMDNAIAGYLLTGEPRLARIGTQMLKGIVALSLGMEFEREDPVVKYLQARAIFNHNHSYEVDGRQVSIDYTPMYVPSFKWNVHVFNIPDNPTYGDIWVSNMRSKDDVPYLPLSLPIVTRAYYEAEDEELRAAAELYIEYIRGFFQSIVQNDWYILTKYEDGVATIQVDSTKPNSPPADLGSFVHWADIFGPDAECNAQLGAALAAYGHPLEKGDCDSGMAGAALERMASNTHFFNHNIYNYFHIGALAIAQLWNRDEIAASLMAGLVQRMDKMMYDPATPNRNYKEYGSDMAGWLLSAATHGYPLTADEARYIMQWYGEAADWYTPWPHWDPWNSMEDGQSFSDYKPPRDETITPEEGEPYLKSHVRRVEMPYIFEYCYSPLRNLEGPQFIDCDIVADPARWGEE